MRQELELSDGVLTVGRSEECTLTIDDPVASREHARLTVVAGVVTLRDLHSRNGTYVNGKRIEGEVVLADGDRLRFGGWEMAFIAAGVERTGPVTVRDIATPLCVIDRQRWWMDLQLDLIGKMLCGGQPAQAMVAFRRLGAGIDAALEGGELLDRERVDLLCAMVVRLSKANADDGAVAWLFDLFRRAHALPGARTFSELRQLRREVLTQAAPALEQCLVACRGRSERLGSEQGAVLDAMMDLAEELRAIRFVESVTTASDHRVVDQEE